MTNPIPGKGEKVRQERTGGIGNEPRYVNPAGCKTKQSPRKQGSPPRAIRLR